MVDRTLNINNLIVYQTLPFPFESIDLREGKETPTTREGAEANPHYKNVWCHKIQSRVNRTWTTLGSIDLFFVDFDNIMGEKYHVGYFLYLCIRT